MTGPITKIAEQEGYAVHDKAPKIERKPVSLPKLDPRLFEFQTETIHRIVNTPSHGFMPIYEMGMGKTVVALQYAGLLGPTRTLVIAPRMVCSQWEDMADDWWPGHPEIKVIHSGKEAKADAIEQNPGISVVSYRLASYYAQMDFDLVIADESHHVMNHRAAQSQAVFRIFENNVGNPRLMLDATPIMTRPHQIRHQLHCLYPTRYGGHRTFAERYCNMVLNEYTGFREPKGLNKDHVRELRERINLVSHRVTMSEYGHLMPKWRLNTLWVKAKRSTATIDKLFANAKDPSDITDEMLATFTPQKLQAAYDWVDNAVRTQDNICVLTYFHHTCNEVAQHLRNKHGDCLVYAVTGKSPDKKRHRMIQDLLDAPRSILVVTMGCIREGINSLAGFDQALLAELYWSQGYMEQVLGRFRRANRACNVTILAVSGTHEEAVAIKLRERSDDQSMLLRKGATSKKFSKRLLGKRSEKEELAELREAAANRIQADEYGL
jgi:superfamily II DNA or RNA helicase